MDLEAIMKALKLQVRRIDEAISGVEALAEHEIQRRRDSRENIRARETKPAPGQPPSQYGKDES
jgi:hypothetical protein